MLIFAALKHEDYGTGIYDGENGLTTETEF
jgi:hypothetical protein